MMFSDQYRRAAEPPDAAQTIKEANWWLQHYRLRWTRKFGQEIKLGLLLRRTDLNDGQTEAVFGGFQGEGCS